MKKSLVHLPGYKRDELKIIVEIIKGIIDAEFIILFGSYARGDWVESKSVGEDGNLYEYRSDYDILVVTKSPGKYERGDYPKKIKRKAAKQEVQTRISMIFHSPIEFKRAVNKGKYFFVDIVKEGIMLYSSGRVTLPEIKELSVKERKCYARKDFNDWFKSAKDFFEQFDYAYDRKKYSIAAFELHQAAERFYTAVSLVLTGYKPKLHDLELLDLRAQALRDEFKGVFLKDTKKEKDLFDLLKRAYVEARYSMSYKITGKELEYLAKRVTILRDLTEKVCKEKIDTYK